MASTRDPADQETPHPEEIHEQDEPEQAVDHRRNPVQSMKQELADLFGPWNREHSLL